MIINHKNSKLIIGTIIISVTCIFIMISIVATKKFSSGDSLISKEDQIKIIRKNIGITITDSSSIDNFTYSKKDGCFDAKIALKKRYIDKVKLEINNFFGEEVTDEYHLWNFKNTCPWWDLKKENVKVAYMKIIGEGDGSVADPSYTHIVWSFIAQNDGKYYLYIAY